MTLLAVFRHGETKWNAEKRLQGRADIPLSNVGRDRLRGKQPPTGLENAVWRASPLERAVETARLLGVTEPAIDHRLVETDWGEWEGRTLSEIRAATDGEVFDREARGLSFRAPCGESPKDVQARLRPFLIEAGGSEQPVVVVTHNGVIRALFSLALDWDMMSAMPVRLDRHCFHFFDVSAAGAVRTLGINTPLRNVTS